MTKCKIVRCERNNIEGLFCHGEWDNKYLGYCLEHAQARKKEDEKFALLEKMEKEEEEEDDYDN